MNFKEWISELEDPQALLQNLQFVMPHHTIAADVSVEIDIKKLDRAWSLDKDYYIPPRNRLNTIGTRYERFLDFLQSGKPIEMPEVGLGPNNIPGFDNGRHRFAVLRDLGLERMPIAVDKSQAKIFRQLFG